MGYWNKTYSVYDEDVGPDTEGSFPIGEDEEEQQWVRPLFPENFDRTKIMKLREENMTMFQKEYLCEPLAVEGDLFDPNDIIELYDKEQSFEQIKKENCDYYMGADFAISHQGDYSVYTVVEVPKNGKPVVRWMERIRGMGLDAQEDRIKDLHNVFDFNRIVLDETNFGSTAKKNLKQAGLPIRGQDFKMKARNNLIVGLKSKIESNEFKIARGCERSRRLTDKLYNELLGFGTTETQSGSISYQSTAKHDDTVMSLAMVISAIEQKKDVVATMAF
jgi:phage FluMu gp28-like protein